MVSTRARRHKLPATAEVESNRRVGRAREYSGARQEEDLLPPLLPSLKEFVIPTDVSMGQVVVNWPYWNPRVRPDGPLLEGPSQDDKDDGHDGLFGHQQIHAPPAGEESASDSLEEMLLDTLKHNTNQNEDDVKIKKKKRKQQYTSGDTAQDQTIYLALQKTGFSSWSHLIETIFLMAKKIPKGKEQSDVTLSHVLNGHSPFYHAGFARAYQNLRQSLRKHAIEIENVEKLQKHSALIQSWSDLSAEEHSWFLTHQHRKCTGNDAARFKSLEGRVVQEQLRYKKELEANAECQAWRYDHMTERQTAQLHADDDRRRQRITIHDKPPRIPRYLAANESLPIERKNTDSLFEFVRVLRTEGNPLSMEPLHAGTQLPGDKHYMPAVESYNRTRGVYKKKECDEVDEDPIIEDILANEDHLFEDASMIVVASAGVFVHLMASDWSHRGREVEIPYSRKGRVLFLQKPLMPKSVTMREKQTRLQKYAVLSNAKTDAHRHTAYCLWRHSQSGTYIIIRSHALVRCGDAPSVFTVKPEYLPEPDRECITDQERCLWKARLYISYPIGARHVQVAHVCVPKGRILSWSAFDFTQIGGHTQETGQISQETVRFWCPSMGTLITWAIGKENELQHGLLSALPHAWTMYTPSGVYGENTYDIHKAHQSSTATDVTKSQWIPPIWRPYSENTAQIPNTFPPKASTKSSASAKIPRKRVRKTPWQGDVDKVNHISTISKKEYMDHLSEAL